MTPAAYFASGYVTAAVTMAVILVFNALFKKWED